MSNVSLTNFSSGCTVPRDCSTVGAHVGMVQLLAFPETHTLFNFSMVYFHLHGNGSNETQQVLIAAMGILHYSERCVCVCVREREREQFSLRLEPMELSFYLLLCCFSATGKCIYGYISIYQGTYIGLTNFLYGGQNVPPQNHNS